MKKNALPILIIGGLIAVVLVFLGVSALIEKYTPSNERADLTEYYHITEDTQVAITLDSTVLEEYATLINGQIYLDYNLVHDSLNSRFYWDANENILLYTTSSDVISAAAEATSYNIGKASKDFGHVVVKATADSALIHLDFVKQYSNISTEFYENPNRIVITSRWGDITVATAKNNTVVRQKGGIKSPILSDIVKGTTLTILEEGNSWHKVCTADGITGYVEAKSLSKITTQTLVSEFEEETFEHIKKDKAINLLWHQVWKQSNNENISSILSKSKGVNVVSPTWFKVSDNEGNISSLASSDYVDYCHSQGVEVWGLLSNLDNGDDVDTGYVLTHTSTRQNLVNQIIAKALQYNLDGINVDLESLNGTKVGDAYIQFLRELSIKCENNELILSADVPVPAAYNAFYGYGEQSNFVDYVVLMAYDQHINARTGEGSTAALDWTRESVVNLLAEGVPADQIVLGIPFYTTLWSLNPNHDENSAEVTYILGFDDIGMDYAKNWMDKNVSEPVWLEDCGQYYGEVTKDGVIYKLWLEDTTSLEKRLQLYKEYSLAGAAFWKAGLECNEAWDIIIKYIN